MAEVVNGSDDAVPETAVPDEIMAEIQAGAEKRAAQEMVLGMCQQAGFMCIALTSWRSEAMQVMYDTIQTHHIAEATAAYRKSMQAQQSQVIG